MKKEKDHKTVERSGGKESTEDSKLQTNQTEHSPVSPLSYPMSPISSTMSPLFPVNPLSSTKDQVQATPPSSPPPKESGYLHCDIA